MDQMKRIAGSLAVGALTDSVFQIMAIRGSSFAETSSNPKKKKIELHSFMFYAACTAGGIASCGLTHMAMTSLDLIKCNMLIDPAKYKSISSGFVVLLKEQSVKGFFRGCMPTLLGYSTGNCKSGFYEFFNKYYSDMFGPEYVSKYKTLIYIVGAASVELIADIALHPMEAVPPNIARVY